MKSNISVPRPVIFSVLLFSLFAFGLAFFISYQQDEKFISELGKLSWFHFLYAKSLRDDMAIIDWSKNLENIENVKAFQVTENSKSIAAGGNKSLLPDLREEGISYLFTTGWFFKISSQKDPQNLLEFSLLYKPNPGCLFWGVFAFILGLIPLGVIKAFGFSRLPKEVFHEVHDHGEKTSEISPRPSGSVALNPQVHGTEVPLVFIDKDYVVQKVTTKALELLKGDPAFIEKRHLFDLSPGQGLITAMKTAQETKILKPFLKHPGLSVSIKLDSNGFLLILETSPRPETPQKP